jgi:hypothetical protein
MSDDMNERIRRALRREPPPEQTPEPEPPKRDLGSGPRADVPLSDPDAFRKWLSAQHHRQRSESVTVDASREKKR